MPNATPSSLSASAREAAVRRQTISCIVPAYNEAENLPRLVPLVAQALEATGHPFEIIVVNDGSADDTSTVLAGLCEIHAPLRALDLSRNFGKDAALTAGLDAARGDAVILMDADLQHSPDLIGQMLQHWYEGAEVVYAVRRNRQDEGLFKRLGTRLFYGMVNRGARFRIPPDAGDFRLMDRRVVAALRRLPERNRFMKGLYAWAGFRHVALPYTPQERHAGRTHYSKWRLLNLALDGLTAFSTWPLRVVTGTGVLSAVVAFLYGAWVVFDYFMWGNRVSGWSTLIVCILLFSGLQMIFLGMLGEYIGRIFEEVKRRPVYIVAEEAGLGLPRRRQRASVADLTGANTAQPDLPDELPPGVTWQ